MAIPRRKSITPGPPTSEANRASCCSMPCLDYVFFSGASPRTPVLAGLSCIFEYIFSLYLWGSVRCCLAIHYRGCVRRGVRRAWGCNRHKVNCNFPAGSFRHASCIVPHRHRGAADREMLLAEEALLSACLSSAMIRASQTPRRAPVGILRTMAGRRCHRGGGSRRAAVGLEAVIEAALWVGQKVRRLQNGGGLAAVACGKQSSAVSRITPAPCCDSRKDAQQAWADESENRVGPMLPGALKPRSASENRARRIFF